jgi:Interferon-induced transmembrane protein
MPRGIADMSDGSVPGGWQQDPADPQQGFGQHGFGQQGSAQPQPGYQGQAWPAGPPGGEPFQQVPPGSGQPGYGVPGYGAPGYGAGMYGKPPPTYMIWARIAAVGGVLFNLILGLPSGMIAIHHARVVRKEWETGNQQKAVSASKKARTWAIVSTVFDVLGIVLLIVIVAASASSSNFSNPSVVAASIKTQLQKRISDPSSQFYRPGLKVTSVVCTKTGSNTDHCIDHFSNGQTASEIAVISANGRSYHTI